MRYDRDMPATIDGARVCSLMADRRPGLTTDNFHFRADDLNTSSDAPGRRNLSSRPGAHTSRVHY